MFTAEYVSRMLGAATVQSVSFNTGSSGSTSYGESTGFSEGSSRSSSITGPGGSRSTSYGLSHTASSTETSGWSRGQSTTSIQRPLQTPDEVRRLHEDWQFVFFRGQHAIQCWRPAYWEAFPSLPKFTLKEVLGTIGRRPSSNQELAYFTAWKNQPQLMKPRERPQELPPPPKPTASPAVLPAPRQLRPWVKITGALALVSLVVWWLLPSKPDVPTQPAPSAVLVVPPPAPSHPLTEKATLPAGETCTLQDKMRYRASGYDMRCDRLLAGGAPLRQASSFMARSSNGCADRCKETPGCTAFSIDVRGLGPEFPCRLFGAGATETAASGWITHMPPTRLPPPTRPLR